MLSIAQYASTLVYAYCQLPTIVPFWLRFFGIYYTSKRNAVYHTWCETIWDAVSKIQWENIWDAVSKIQWENIWDAVSKIQWENIWDAVSKLILYI